MALFHNSAIIGASGNQETGYEIERSLRFNSSDSAYLSRTPSVAGNRKTWTWAGWVKKTTNGSYGYLFDSNISGTQEGGVRFLQNDSINVWQWNGSADVFLASTNAVFRDNSAWLHLVVAFDTTQATAANRIKVYINGAQATLSGSYPTQNADANINAAVAHAIGRQQSGSRYFSGYLADIHFIDGQALDPTSFGEFDDNGIWQPKAYTGTYGTNGFHLPFSDNSSSAALGTDTSGAGNNWTVNNISVTAGAGNDSLVDTPTSYGTDTGAGGEVRGNYCTWNPLARVGIYTASLSNGNLDCTSNADARVAYGSIAIPSSGKWFFEVTVTTSSTGAYVGVASYNGVQAAYPQDTVFPSVTYYGSSGQKDVDGVYSTYGAAYTNAVIGVAVNVDSSQVTFYKDGVSQGVINKSVVGTFPFVGTAGGTYTYTINAGQRPFAYTAPSGFKALCTTNLPEPTIADGSTAMDVVLDTGANILTAAQSAIGGSADLLWIKDRANSNNHQLIDTVRGGTATLQSNTTAAETTYSAPSGSSVAWTWDAGSSTVTNTDGTITSQVRANPSAGFSIVTYTGNGTNGATVGHQLNSIPGLILLKSRDTQTVNSSWAVWHSSLSTSQYLTLNATDAVATDPGAFTSTTPTSSVFSLGTYQVTNTSLKRYVAYCFAPVAGYSAFGSYTGNGSADGPFVYTGFRPRWVMIKNTTSGDNWNIVDTARGTYNVVTPYLDANTSGAEGTYSGWDLLSNGFKLRNVGSSLNTSGDTYIYAAFAEHPFKTSRGR